MNFIETMKKTPLKRKTPLRAKKSWNGKTTALRTKKRLESKIDGNKSKSKRRYTKASKQRRKKGEWSTKTADSYFSKFIRERDGQCKRCGTTERLTCSHYHGRAKSNTRFDPQNNIALCSECHALWEGPKTEYTEFMIEWLGVDEFIALQKRAGTFKERKEAVAEWRDYYLKNIKKNNFYEQEAN